jgi:hypothetical protein
MKLTLASNFPFARVFTYEWRRLNRTDVWVIALVFCGLLLILGFASTLEAISPEGTMINPSLLEQGIPSLSGLFVAFFVMLGLGTEYRQGTFRKRLLNGYGRVDLLMVPLLMIAFSILIFCLLTIFTLLLVQVVSGFDMFHFWNTHLIANLVFKQVLIGAFATLLVNITRTSGLAIVLYFVYGFLESILSLGLSLGLQEPSYSAFLPLNGGTSYAMLSEGLQAWYDLVPAFWVAVFMGVSWLKIKNMEF